MISPTKAYNIVPTHNLLLFYVELRYVDVAAVSLQDDIIILLYGVPLIMYAEKSPECACIGYKYNQFILATMEIKINNPFIFYTFKYV